MKEIIIISSLLLGTITSCTTNTKENTTEVTVSTEQTQKTYTLKKFKSSCCVGIVKYSLDELDGFIMMKPNLEKSEITVWYDQNKSSEQEIINAINTTPYKVL
ncbi:heavy-metal-associated domain-containing protein [Flammeovirga kamogawensis]|uniref:Heavy-metal-associated domain-containing protein n=1 Tax=Flammeovirga kamogawensis TaxID=373891 RepID=A0ABX8GV31_9BACT|nr:heavy-metal-associated domain-containing protein [Flammeovirga kamogawensis]MBB6459675.1 copper chaperone CopZ [Flammeovirga kamogawensis]QWG07263.1 heavy-metal-associated domain-containing protein [Flammeovirga kamogawensis]TRX69083.1 heavy-metal-associated domain-containing protein [Flammeovirga kamogawensis]